MTIIGFLTRHDINLVPTFAVVLANGSSQCEVRCSASLSSRLVGDRDEDMECVLGSVFQVQGKWLCSRNDVISCYPGLCAQLSVRFTELKWGQDKVLGSISLVVEYIYQGEMELH